MSEVAVWVMMLTHCTVLYLRSRRHKMHLFSVLRVVMGCTWGGGVTLRNLAFTRTVDLRAMSEEELEGAKESLTSERKHTRQKKDSEGPTELSLTGLDANADVNYPM